MPTWNNTPPTTADSPALPIRRTPHLGVLQAIVTSVDLLGCDTHFFKGHTMPCERPDCEACGKNIPFRWHGYLACLDARTNVHFIFEMTAQAAEAFIEYRETHKTTRGCLFQAQRLHKRPNGRVIIQTKTAALEKLRLPKAPDLKASMAIIWQLPSHVVVDGGRMKDAPTVVLNRAAEILKEYSPVPAAEGNGDR